LWVPTPAQVELREATVPNLLWGDSAGVAKSFGLRWNGISNCLDIPNYEVLLLRRTYPELEETHLKDMEREALLMNEHGPMEAVYRKGERRLWFENGSFIKAGHCESESDMTKMLSREYDEIIFDEGSTLIPKTMLEISSRARSAKPLVVARGGAFVRTGSNPGGIGALYLKDFYIDRKPDPEEYPDYDPNDYGYIPGRLTDNPYLDVRYEKRLKQLGATRRRQLLAGDWSVFDGQFFAFDSSIHVAALEAR
jgi:Terminase-like family.